MKRILVTTALLLTTSPAWALTDIADCLKIVQAMPYAECVIAWENAKLRSTYTFPDLLDRLHAARRSLAQRYDRGEITKEEASVAFKRIGEEVLAEGRKRIDRRYGLVRQPPMPEKVILDVGMAIIPPTQYDHPFKGQLTTQVVNTQEQVRQICNMNVYPSIACTFPNPPNGPCKLVRLRATDIQALGWTLEMVERHEMAHCNGWPADHAGIRHTPDEWELKNPLGEMFSVIFEDPLVEEHYKCRETGKKQSVCEKEILEHNPLARQRQKCIRAGLTAKACRKEELRGIP
jgi:hypothetical protein